MSDLAKTARREMRAKANRLGGGMNDPHKKTDASSWTPGPSLETTRKTGARPIRSRIYKFGGKIQGDRAQPHAGKTPRGGFAGGGKVGGPLSMTNVPKLNEEEFGSYHEGGYKRGGAPKAGQDMAAMKASMKRDDGGRAVMQRRINDHLEDSGTDAQRTLRMLHSRKPPISPPIFKTDTKPNFPAERDLDRGDYDAAPPMASPSGRGPETGFKKGGKPHRAHGGRTKGKTNIIINIAQPKPPEMPNPTMGPTRPPMPPPMPPPQMPPPAEAGPPPGAGPGPMAGAGPPPGPMMRKSGGRTKMDAGAMSGEGRLEKIALQRRAG